MKSISTMRASGAVGGDARFKPVMDWIKVKKSLLLVTHERPDGDAFGTLFGCTLCFAEMGVKCRPYIQEAVPERYRTFVPNNLLVGGAVDMMQFDGVLCVDSANEKRLGLPAGVAFENIRLPVCNIDHHIDNTKYGEISCVDPNSAAAAELIATMAMVLDLPISPDAATALLLGIVTDTGGFRFSNTRSHTFRTASWLIDREADYERIMREIFFSEPIALLRLQAHIFETMRFAFGGRLAYFCLTPELLAQYGIAARDTEDLIEVARVIKAVDVVCRMQKTEDGVRFSFRSQDPSIEVIGLAHQLGGGGHKMAAGAIVENIDLDKAEELMLHHATKIFNEQMR